MPKTIEIDERSSLVIESPDEAPQFPLSEGWWRLTLTTGPKLEDRFVLQVRNASKLAEIDPLTKKAGTIISWVCDNTKIEQTHLKFGSIKLVISQMTRHLGTVQRT